MSLLLLSLALPLGLVLSLLAVPVTVAFRVEHIKGIRGQVSFRWLFGLVRYRAAMPDAGRAESHDKVRIAGKVRKRGKGSGARGILRLMRQSEFRRRFARLVRAVLRTIQARDLYLHLRIGLGDPADTGRLWALFGPIAGLAGSLRGAEIRLEPEFSDPVLELESHGEFRLVPLQIVALTAFFAASPSTLRAWHSMREGQR